MIRRTKLVCTIGPATIERIDELVLAGMDIARINFSHGTPELHALAYERVRSAADAAGRTVAVLADLSGPKIRLGELEGGSATLEAGGEFTLWTGTSRPGNAAGADVRHPNLGHDLEPGDRILLSDGAVELRVIETGDEIRTEVIRGGEIRSRAGVNVPSQRLSGPVLTERDLVDAPRAVELGVDYLAQSFVRSASDVVELRSVIGEDGPRIVAKIETRPAIDDFDAICDAADAVMIARGDLGVELPYEEVPILQKQLVRRALDVGVPTIVATQMLESMISAPRPTRAEASDVANAIFDGADAIMLSGETAIGAFPILAAEAAVRICRLCEADGGDHLPAGAPPRTSTDAGALAYAAAAVAASDLGVAAIACYTRTGQTAQVLAALRPSVPILAFSPDAAVIRRLALIHGVDPRRCVPPSDSAERLGLMAWLLDEDPSLPPGAAIVLVASTATPGTGPNLLEMHRIPG